MELTAKARANLATGATTGPGTGYCATCGGDKEPTRLNSRQCRTCAGTPSPEPSPDTVTVRTTVPREVWAAARERARSTSTTVAAVLREALLAYTTEPSVEVPREVTYEVTREVTRGVKPFDREIPVQSLEVGMTVTASSRGPLQVVEVRHHKNLTAVRTSDGTAVSFAPTETVRIKP